MITLVHVKSIWWYLGVLQVLHRPVVVDIGVNTIEKHAICLKDYRLRSFLSIRLLFVCLFDLILYVPSTVFQL